MDVTKLSSQAEQVAMQSNEAASASSSQKGEADSAGRSGGAGESASREAPVANPVIALDSETNTVVLKFQESDGGESFQLPGKTALQYQQHQEKSAEGMDKAAE